MAKEFVRVRFVAPGGEKFERGFYAMSKAVADMSPVMDRIGDDIRHGVLEQFMTQGSAKLGHPWAPLSPAYAKWKDARYPGMPILVASGEMRSSLLNPSAITTSPSSVRYDPASGIWEFHQTGTKHMPQRKPVVVTPGDRRQWDRYFAEWLAAEREKWL